MLQRARGLRRISFAAGFNQIRRHSSAIREPRWKQYELSAVGSGCGCTSNTDDNFQIQSDTPKASGGIGAAPQPVQLLLAALVGCEQATAHFLARKLKTGKLEKIDFFPPGREG